MLQTFTTGFRFALCFLLFALCSHVGAASRDEDEPIRANARSVEANDKTGVVVYSGNVLVEQGRLSIQADRIEITSRKGRTEFVRATGKPAKLRQRPDADSEEVRAEAGRVDYHVSLRKVDLIGQVTLWRSEDVFTADVLHYNLDSKSLNASGDSKDDDGRVHAVIQPKKPDSQPPSRP